LRQPASNATEIFAAQTQVVPGNEIPTRKCRFRKMLHFKALPHTENIRDNCDKGVAVTGVDLDFYGIRFNAIERGGTDPG
jgi:hypothetical protein